MKDRTPLYPGRVTLVPVEGMENTYTLIRADEPKEAGTPINKATLLTDETATRYGLADTAVPDDVLAILADAARVQGGALKRADGSALILPAPTANMAVGSYVGTGSYGSSAPNELVFDFTPRLVILTGTKREPVDVETPVYWMLQHPDTVMRMHANTQSGVTWGENSVSWWSENIAYSGGTEYPGDAQLNESGVTYYYIAFGNV